MRHDCRKHEDTSVKKPISIGPAHKPPHTRMGEGGKRMRISPKFLRRHNLRRVMAESTVGAEKELGYRIIQKSRKEKEEEKGKGV